MLVPNFSYFSTHFWSYFSWNQCELIFLNAKICSGVWYLSSLEVISLKVVVFHIAYSQNLFKRFVHFKFKGSRINFFQKDNYNNRISVPQYRNLIDDFTTNRAVEFCELKKCIPTCRLGWNGLKKPCINSNYNNFFYKEHLLYFVEKI